MAVAGEVAVGVVAVGVAVLGVVAEAGQEAMDSIETVKTVARANEDTGIKRDFQKVGLRVGEEVEGENDGRIKLTSRLMSLIETG